ncbi:MAG: hypothetical protein AB3N18_18950 [Allomuricauda sp.]
MKKVLLLLFLVVLGVNAQQERYQLKFEHFSESRGDFEPGMLLEIPYSNVVMVENSLKTSSGFGLTLNFHGHIVMIDHMETLSDGSIQVVLRREDGRSFYGYKPTIKAILVKDKHTDRTRI